MTHEVRIPLPRAVFFDLDGTLIDSLPDIAWALNETRARRGLPRVADDAVKGWVGSGAAVLVARSLACADERDPRVAPFLADFLATYEAHADTRTRVYPGALELLDLLATRRVRSVVTTNKPHGAAMAALRGLGILGRFQAVVTPESAGARKPDPRFMAAALAAAEVAPGDALVVGDGVQDVEAARAAGIRCVALLGGYGDPAALRAAGADWYVATIAEVAPQLV